jgi:hypothetical protein
VPVLAGRLGAPQMFAKRVNFLIAESLGKVARSWADAKLFSAGVELVELLLQLFELLPGFG